MHPCRIAVSVRFPYRTFLGSAPPHHRHTLSPLTSHTVPNHSYLINHSPDRYTHPGMTANYAPIRDIPLLITSPTSHSERRITPTWSLSTLKQKLEPITGIPPSSQRLSLVLPDQSGVLALEADNEDTTLVGSWPLQAGGEIQVCQPHSLCGCFCSLSNITFLVVSAVCVREMRYIHARSP